VTTFAPVADGVFVARTHPLDVNVTLVVGDETALVIDTLSTDAQATALLAAIREITDAPLTVLNTHFHFDHCFGNTVVAASGRPVWAHENTATELTERGSRWQRRWAADYTATDPVLAEGLAQVNIQIPDHLVRDTAHIDLGGRRVTVSHPGHGHTNGDLFAYVDDADVLVAGDLVEESGPPDFADAYPIDWAEAVATMLHQTPAATVVVPGHGALVDSGFVHRQHADLAAFAWLIRDGHRDGATVDAVAARSPWPAEACRTGVVRGYAALDLPNA
jgi:glyoxylase-like metal-dependent hydrolase (beta-lactamase superfamily II)